MPALTIGHICQIGTTLVFVGIEPMVTPNGVGALRSLGGLDGERWAPSVG